MTIKTRLVGLLQYAQGDDVQVYLQRWLAQSMRVTDGLFDPVTGHNHNGLGGNGSLVGCHLIGSFDGAVAWTMPTANTWTETPIQTTVTLSGARTRIEFAFTVTGPTKGQMISYTIMVDGGLPGVSPPALGIADIPENNYLVSCSGTYYVTPSAASHRLAIGLYGPAGVQLSNQIQSTLYVTEQNPSGPSGVGSGGGLMTWRGSWSASTAYNVNDGVSYNGGSYVCIGSVGPTSTTPDTDAAHWGVLAQPGAAGPAGPTGATGAQGPAGTPGMAWRGTWASTNAYNVNDGVAYQGSSYICSSAIAAGGGAPPTDTAHWGLMAQQGATGATGAQGPAGPAGTNTWGSP